MPKKSLKFALFHTNIGQMLPIVPASRTLLKKVTCCVVLQRLTGYFASQVLLENSYIRSISAKFAICERYARRCDAFHNVFWVASVGIQLYNAEEMEQFSSENTCHDLAVLLYRAKYYALPSHGRWSTNIREHLKRLCSRENGHRLRWLCKLAVATRLLRIEDGAYVCTPRATVWSGLPLSRKMRWLQLGFMQLSPIHRVVYLANKQGTATSNTQRFQTAIRHWHWLGTPHNAYGTETVSFDPINLMVTVPANGHKTWSCLAQFALVRQPTLLHFTRKSLTRAFKHGCEIQALITNLEALTNAALPQALYKMIASIWEQPWLEYGAILHLPAAHQTRRFRTYTQRPISNSAWFVPKSQQTAAASLLEQTPDLPLPDAINKPKRPASARQALLTGLWLAKTISTSHGQPSFVHPDLLADLNRTLTREQQKDARRTALQLLRKNMPKPKSSRGRPALAFDDLMQALSARTSLWISYQAAAEATPVIREITPLQLYTFNQLTYLKAWCHQQLDWRTFRLDRLSAYSPA